MPAISASAYTVGRELPG